jgi:phospholipase D1/2
MFLSHQAHTLPGLPSLPELVSPSSSRPPPNSPRSIHFVTPPVSPAARTGPPRSLSFSFSSPGSPLLSRQRRHDTIQGHCEQDEMSFSPDGMRGALDDTTATPPRDKKGKRRATKVLDDHMDVLHESPTEETSCFDFNVGQGTEAKKEGQPAGSPNHAEISKQRSFTQHTTSNRHSGWSRLRSLLPQIVDKGRLSTVPEQEPVHCTSVNITDELIGGGLSALMLGLWFQRDDKGRRRIPVLLHRLRIRVSDSLNPMHIRKSVFRIECEYANGAARWVIYRELRDFLRLHLHYKLTNVYNRVVDLPEFPKSSRSPSFARY